MVPDTYSNFWKKMYSIKEDYTILHYVNHFKNIISVAENTNLTNVKGIAKKVLH